ncbi:hypothetical protein O6H91_01G088700 [Diphasiastrum complanatum]|uniref:Uncharacterized protein n=1 Tax=Diphasiastrum complanatum TaxID=34168 RepID=A0ACC2ESX8_DIPCM|nr:hypothetical protein O6H91_01G088700 [Diphasiastrum complanatum]
MPNLQTLITGSFSARQVSSPAQPCLKGRFSLNESPKSVIKESAVISPESASSESMDHCLVNDMHPQRCHDQEDLTSDESSTGSSFKKTLLQVGSSEANDPTSFLDQKTSSQFEETLSSTSRDSMVSNGCLDAHRLSDSITIGNSGFHLAMGSENRGKTDVPESIELHGFTTGSANVNKSREWHQDSFLKITSELESNQTSKLLPGQFLASKMAHASEAIVPKVPLASNTEGDTQGDKREFIRQKINASHCSENENMRTSDSPKSASTRYTKMQDSNTSLATQSRARSDYSLNSIKGGRFSPRNLPGKAMKPSPIKPSPSKWDDAQKWLISSISSDIITHPQADNAHISSPRLSSNLPYPNEVCKNKSSGTDQSLRIFGAARVANRPANKLEISTLQGSPRQILAPDKHTNSNDDYVLKRGGFPEKSGHGYDQKQKPLLEGRTIKVTDAHKLSVVHPSGNSDSPSVAMLPNTSMEAPLPASTIVNLSTEQRASLERINPTGVRGSERLFNHAGENRASSNMILYDIHMTDKYADTVVQTPDHGLSYALKNEFFVQTPKLGGSLPMKDVSTEVSPPVSRYRDMGTQMTPLSSSGPSKCTTPISNISPARHNTPAKQTVSSAQANLELLELQSCQLMAKLEHRDQSNFNGLDRSTSNTWSTREEEEEESSKSLRYVDLTEIRKSVIEARAAAWEEAEQAKSTSRYKREESKVQAWENHQKAKAEAEMRKLEVKLEKMRSHQTEKIMNKLAAAHRHAENMRAAAQAEQAEQLAKSKERANQMRISGHVPTPFCACFTCRT